MKTCGSFACKEIPNHFCIKCDRYYCGNHYCPDSHPIMTMEDILKLIPKDIK